MDGRKQAQNEVISVHDDLISRVRSIDRTIWRLTIRRDELQSCLLPGAVRYDVDKVQSSPKDKLADIAAAVVDIDRTISELQRAKADAILQLSERIEKLDDEREKVILTAYFIGRKSMTEISDKLGYSVKHVYRLRKMGLQKVANNENVKRV